MKKILLFLIISFVCTFSYAQVLDKASTVQLEQQIRQVIKQFSKDIVGYVANPNEAGALEQATFGMMRYVQHPKVKFFSDIVPQQQSQPRTYEDYLRNARAFYANKANTSTFKLDIDFNSFKRRSPSIVGDSVTVEVFFTEQTTYASIPMSVIFSGRLRRDKDIGFGYFTRLKINGTKTIKPTADAITFYSNSTNPYVIHEDEQSLSTVLNKISEQIASNIPAAVQKLKVSKLSLSGCCIFDKFSREISVSIASNIQYHKKDIEVYSENSNESNYTISGNYEIFGENFRFNLILSDLNGNKIANVSNNDLPLRWFKVNNTAFIPSEYEPTMAEKKIIERNMVSDPLGLEVKLTTNKGRDNVMFKEGEKMEVLVKTNKPCYVRILYRQADQRLTLLFEKNIIMSEINRDLSLGEADCIAPFGRESLLIFASMQTFGILALKTENIKTDDGEYNIEVINGTLEEACKLSNGKGAGKQVNKLPIASDNIAIFTTKK
jgi:hypothetical protein